MDTEQIATVAQNAPAFWEAMYWLGVWWCGGIAGAAMAHLDRNWRSCWDLLSICVTSGFLAFGVTSFIWWSCGAGVGDGPVFLGLAGACGLAGKYRDVIIRGFASGMAARLQAAAGAGSVPIELPKEMSDGTSPGNANGSE